MRRRSDALALLVWGLLFTTARAADPGPVSTAPHANDSPSAIAQPAPSQNDSTAGQISAWISDGGEVTNQQGDQPPVKAPRVVHGEIDAAVGTGGFHGVSGVADIPVGEQGDLVVAGSNSSGRFRGGRGYQSDSVSVGLFLGGAKPAGSCDQRRWNALPTDAVPTDALPTDAGRTSSCGAPPGYGEAPSPH